MTPNPSPNPGDGPAPDPADAPPRVMLVTPHYGAIEAATARTAKFAVKNHADIRVVCEGESCSSVLPQAFNELLAHALVLRDEGRVTHLAMLHADISAPPGWLDVLWAEMWWNRLAAVSAVVPIKNGRRLTSTAIGDASDRWRVNRHVTLDDRRKTPETFTAADVCGPGEVLLINTGLMLIDLRLPFWSDGFAFQFHSRVRTSPAPDGRTVYHAESRTEDWEMSHDLHAAGLRYGATWKVRVTHHGRGEWANR